MGGPSALDAQALKKLVAYAQKSNVESKVRPHGHSGYNKACMVTANAVPSQFRDCQARLPASAASRKPVPKQRLLPRLRVILTRTTCFVVVAV